MVPLVVKIFDFGVGELLLGKLSGSLTSWIAAHKVGPRPQNFQCAVECCAPEIVFFCLAEKVQNPVIEPLADIWALGAAVCLPLLFILCTSSECLYADIHDCYWSFSTFLRCWHDRPTTSHVHDDWFDAPRVALLEPQARWTSHRKALLRGCVDNEDTDALIRLLKTVLILHPSIRPTMAVQNQWFHN